MLFLLATLRTRGRVTPHLRQVSPHFLADYLSFVVLVLPHGVVGHMFFEFALEFDVTCALFRLV